ncbi:MAG: hypothetical protein K5640_07600 [Treponema sp.]|nr:hypothetical protein [Treponema sp.]
MKKLIMALAVALMISAVFAESKKVKSLSFTFASEKFTVKEEFGGSLSAEAKIKFTNLGLSYSTMKIKDTGFSTMSDIYIGRSSTSDFLSDLAGLNAGLKLGLGYAPVNNEKTILALHGFAGFDTKLLLGEKQGYRDDEAYLMTFIDLLAGIDVRLAQKLTNSLGLYAGLDLYTNLWGTAYWTEDSDTTFKTKAGGFGIQPRIGLCWNL